MVFTQNSNENTQKIILSSVMRTRGTANHAQFDFQTPLTIPQGYVCLMNVEGFFGTVPSLFSGDYIDSGLNYFNKGNTNLWTDTIAKGVYTRASKEKMTLPSNQASFVLNLLISLEDPALNNRLPGLGFTDEITGDMILAYDGTKNDGERITITNLAGTLGNEKYAKDDGKKEFLAKYFAIIASPRFAFVNASEGTYSLRGPWVMSLGLNPLITYTIAPEGKQQVELQTSGLQFMNLNCGIGRSVMATQTTDMRLSSSDIIWTIPLPADPLEMTYYTNFSSGGKVACTNSVIETLEIYFTDKYNFNVMGMSDWTVILTFDYMEKEKPAQPITSKDVRRFITSF